MVAGLHTHKFLRSRWRWLQRQPKSRCCPGPWRAHASKSPVSCRDDKAQSGRHRHEGCVCVFFEVFIVRFKSAATWGLETKTKTELSLVPTPHSAGRCQSERADMAGQCGCGTVVIALSANPVVGYDEPFGLFRLPLEIQAPALHTATHFSAVGYGPQLISSSSLSFTK